MSKTDMFDNLVRNAIDFFLEAVNQLEQKPKYSVINFYSAIEIFLKSRLMWEHWSLIVSDINEANFQKYKEGNFRSVNLDEIEKRFENIVNKPINKDAIEVFKRIKEHRNRLIHFFDNKAVGDEDLTFVLSEQCQGWYYLQRLLMYQWKDLYSSYSDELNDLDIKMKGNRHFLATKYEHIKSDLEKGKSRGVVFIECPICGFEAYRHRDILGPLKKLDCLVCDGSETALLIECPSYDGLILSRELGEGKCGICGYDLSLKYLISEFQEVLRPKEEIFRQNAICSFCEYPEETVVPVDDKFLCLSCLEIHDFIDQCEYCNQNITKDSEDTFLYGCGLCSGRLG